MAPTPTAATRSASLEFFDAEDAPSAAPEIVVADDARPRLDTRRATRPPGLPFSPVARPAELLRWQPIVATAPSVSLEPSESQVWVDREAPAAPSTMAYSWLQFASLALGATGVVFGDIGTSCLYTFSGIYSTESHAQPQATDVVATLSMIVWSLLLIVCGKYVLLVMSVSHHGEGGTFALLQAISGGPSPPRSEHVRRALTLLAMLGFSLLVGDGAITPAISVLGALEGLPIDDLGALGAKYGGQLRVLLALCVLLSLFSQQKHGSAFIGRVAGPVMLLWFGALAALGAHSLCTHPREARLLLGALDPSVIVRFWTTGAYRGERAWRSLGGVVLAFTGAEALYADMGHFGRPAISVVWLCVVLPALLLQYAGQAAVLIARPEAIANPFYSAVPPRLLWPVLLLATAAAVIASQAMISGVFALLSQAHALGFVPRILVLHTNPEQSGQVFVPEANALLCAACIALTLAFKSSARLGTAYGVAVTLDALVTTSLFAVVLRTNWRWPLAFVLALIAPMAALDLAFCSANLVKVPQGGWVPLAISGVACLCMHTYKWGRMQEVRSLKAAARAAGAADGEALVAAVSGGGVSAADDDEEAMARRIHALSVVSTVPALLAMLRSRAAADSASPPLLVRTPAVGVFLTPFEWHVPQSVASLASALGCLPATIVLLTVKYEALPFVHAAERVTFEPLDSSAGVFRVIVHLGYAEATAVARLLPRALAEAAASHAHEHPALRPLLHLRTPDGKFAATLDDDGSIPATLGAPAVEAQLGDKSLLPGSPGTPTAILRARALAAPAPGSEPRVTFVLNRLSIADRGGHSSFTLLRIWLYRLLVTNARDARGVLGLPASSTIEVCSVRLL